MNSTSINDVVAFVVWLFTGQYFHIQPVRGFSDIGLVGLFNFLQVQNIRDHLNIALLSRTPHYQGNVFL